MESARAWCAWVSEKEARGAAAAPRICMPGTAWIGRESSRRPAASLPARAASQLSSPLAGEVAQSAGGDAQARRVPRRAHLAVYAVLLFAAGLAYRATFISQAFNASDEAFLPALASRVLKGQVVYRDFIYASPPLTVFKEAGVAAILGSNYGFLASRWVFAVEVSVGSVLAFLIITRYAPPLVAFLATLPTIFFTTVLYAYSNFNFDAQVLFLIGFLILVWEGERERRLVLMLAGALCGMAFLAKPTYLAMGVGICGLGILRPWMAGPRRWPYFAIGFAGVIGLVFAAIALAGLWADFRHQAFGLLFSANPRSTRFYLIQDWPKWLLPPGRGALPVLANRPWAARVRAELFPPFVPIVAAVLEYLHGIDLSTMLFAYAGTFLGIPVALSFLYMGWRLWGGAEVARVAVPAVVGAFIVLAGAVVTHGAPYLDAPRDQLTASFTAPRLAGISTNPARAKHVDGLVAAIESNTQPSDSTFVFPDGQAYYVITGRNNPTRLDWYNLLATSPAMSAESLETLKRDPPKFIFVQEYRESDFLHLCPLIPEMYAAEVKHHGSCPRTFDREPVWRPIYAFITANYELVTTVEGVRVYRLR